MNSFAGKIAVVTGGGSGVGRELVCQLAAEGCSVAACDVDVDSLAETRELALGAAGAATAPISVHECDVSDEAAMLRFRGEALQAHRSEHVDLVFANAAIGGGGSFVNDPREQWERVFAINLVGRLLHRADVPAAADREPPRGCLST